MIVDTPDLLSALAILIIDDQRIEDDVASCRAFTSEGMTPIRSERLDTQDLRLNVTTSEVKLAII